MKTKGINKAMVETNKIERENGKETRGERDGKESMGVGWGGHKQLKLTGGERDEIELILFDWY